MAARYRRRARRGVRTGRPACGACPRASPPHGGRGSCDPPRRARREGLRRGPGVAPRIAVAERRERRADGEVGGRDGVEVVPGQRERHRDAGARPRAVGRDQRRPAGAGGVDEDLPLAVVLDERRGRDVRVECRGPGGDGPRRRCGVLERHGARQRDDDVQALRTAGLDGRGQPGAGQRLTDEPRRGDGHAERRALRRVEVEDQLRCVIVAQADQGRVVLDRALVGEPQQRPAVVAQGVGDVALGGVRPDGGPRDPLRGVAGQVLLHERRLARPHAHDRERPLLQLRQDPVGHRVEVVDDLALGDAGAVEGGGVEAAQRDALARLPGFLGHGPV